MRTKIQPETIFNVWSPDSVAECLSGIPESIYKKIWNEIVTLYPTTHCDDWIEYSDDDKSLSEYWDMFTDAEKEVLNDLAKNI